MSPRRQNRLPDPPGRGTIACGDRLHIAGSDVLGRRDRKIVGKVTD